MMDFWGERPLLYCLYVCHGFRNSLASWPIIAFRGEKHFLHRLLVCHRIRHHLVLGCSRSWTTFQGDRTLAVVLPSHLSNPCHGLYPTMNHLFLTRITLAVVLPPYMSKPSRRLHPTTDHFFCFFLQEQLLLLYWCSHACVTESVNLSLKIHVPARVVLLGIGSVPNSELFARQLELTQVRWYACCTSWTPRFARLVVSFLFFRCLLPVCCTELRWMAQR